MKYLIKLGYILLVLLNTFFKIIQSKRNPDIFDSFFLSNAKKEIKFKMFIALT